MTGLGVRRAVWVRAHLQRVHWYFVPGATTVCGKPLDPPGAVHVKVSDDTKDVTCRNCKRSIRRRGRPHA